MANRPLMVGIIGGTGFTNPEVLGVQDPKDVELETPFGKPSSPLLTGTLSGVRVAVLARHGRQHTIMPSHVNYRANIWALHQLGCTHLVVSTACGSLREEIRPGQLLLLDQFIDRTTKRPLTFFDGTCASFAGICHLPMGEPFCGRTRAVVQAAADELGITLHPSGTTVCIEGPRFSTKAESNLFRSWGCDVVNMTTVPEVTLAKEAGLCYAAIAMPTDYDCWRPDQAGVGVADVMAVFRANVDSVVRLLRELVPRLALTDWDEQLRQNRDTVADNTMLPDH
ncbi:S-methyl-5'-thioadenosine phosphorylase-like [Pollicipes pollicipes]|uniref:S-methyl-5'-thioadenosine phosphorylase-like n=1 Tax=Pollicipes pollicipes TaxID=41117 RepID=UPI0018852D39|nr:S-methyl-5'-thioadenosine phosphorylase-like [Pollicipes pollicipes]XP_037090460.1 S-methyl-5'-thioadenosine phosphorylase-like [Pollicipes pollicipes]